VIIDNQLLKGLKSELSYLDETMDKLGFVRWQWEYYRATYDCKFEDRTTSSEYFLRVNTRVLEGKLESPHAILTVEDIYIGLATFPHGLNYNTSIPDAVLKAANQKLDELHKALKID
jgi:hypothetical protein